MYDCADNAAGNCAGTRNRATAALVRYLATDPTNSGNNSKVILMGGALRKGALQVQSDPLPKDISCGMLHDRSNAHLPSHAVSATTRSA